MNPRLRIVRQYWPAGLLLVSGAWAGHALKACADPQRRTQDTECAQPWAAAPANTSWSLPLEPSTANETGRIQEPPSPRESTNTPTIPGQPFKGSAPARIPWDDIEAVESDELSFAGDLLDRIVTHSSRKHLARSRLISTCAGKVDWERPVQGGEIRVELELRMEYADGTLHIAGVDTKDASDEVASLADCMRETVLTGNAPGLELQGRSLDSIPFSSDPRRYRVVYDFVGTL